MLQSIGPDLWAMESTLNAGGIAFPGRMTVARVPSGKLWLHSPVKLTDADVAALADLGEVGYLVAPSSFHHLSIPAAKAIFPAAAVWASPKLKTKVPDLPIDHTLDESPPEDWQGAITPLPLEGAPSLQEFSFVHHPSGSLMVTDVLFNMREYDGFLSRVVFWLTGTYKKLAVSRVFRSAVKDRAAMARSVERVLAQDFDRLVPCHGEIVDPGGKAATEQALAVLR